SKGGKLWSKDFSSQSMALGALSSRHLGRLAVETTDGNIVTAIDVLDFVDENLKEFYGDILVAKLNKKGTQLWSIMLGDHSTDRPRQIWALPGGGVLLLARFMKTGYGSEVTDGVPVYSVFIKIDKNGKTQFSKKMDWDAISAERLTNGSFIVLADIPVVESEQPTNILGPELVPHALPTMIKLDGDFNVVWAKSMEMIPTEMNTPTGYSGGVMTIGKTVIRLAGGDFRAVQSAPDGGFIAFGYNNLMLTQGISSGARFDISSDDVALRPFVAVKVDANGNYQWEKKLTVNMVSGGDANDFHVVRTVDGKFVIMKDVVYDSDAVEAKSHDVSVKRKAFLDKCAELKTECNIEENLVPELQTLANATKDALKVLAEASAVNIGLIKTDADFNPMWIKQYSVERDISGYDLQPTADKGVVVSGSMLTTKLHMVMGTLEPYTEAALIKVDANGEANGCVSVKSHTGAAIEDQSGYLVMQDMKVSGPENFKLNINKKVKEKMANAKNIARDICKYKKSNVVQNCSRLNSDTYIPATGQTADHPTAKTWAQINFNNTKEVAADVGKNKIIHEELLPILNQVYDNQVKLKDSMKSMWLTYIFSRQVTLEDVEAVRKYYEGLGYKIDDSDGGDLWISKVGLTLHMTFSVQNSMIGKLEVMF
ncbi:MAG: hypothetical protein PHY40_03830, partial [Patescibacteria group bacterium]|nr:hypothetical protein [Patescibacteria group bacterium]